MPGSDAISVFGFVRPPVVIGAAASRRHADRHRGFSLPELMIALLLIMLGGSALVSTMVAARVRASSQARLSAAFRLAIELSDWTRQGGMRALPANTQNPFDLVDASDAVPDCFSKPCTAEDAALFYLHHWRRRLVLEVPDARVLICRGMPAPRIADEAWVCEDTDPDYQSRVIKIGWAQSGSVGGLASPPRLVLALT